MSRYRKVLVEVKGFQTSKPAYEIVEGLFRIYKPPKVHPTNVKIRGVITKRRGILQPRYIIEPIAESKRKAFERFRKFYYGEWDNVTFGDESQVHSGKIDIYHIEQNNIDVLEGPIEEKTFVTYFSLKSKLLKQIS